MLDLIIFLTSALLLFRLVQYFLGYGQGKGTEKWMLAIGPAFPEVMSKLEAEGDAPGGTAEEEEKETFQIIVVGGGVAGCAMAKCMGDRGLKTLLLERDLREPNRIVGELMQPGGLKALESLNMIDCVDGIDSQVSFGYVIHNGKEQPLVLELSDEVSGKQFTARTFHHGRFIQNLRKAAMRTPNVTVRQGIVGDVIEAGHTVVGVTYKDERGARRRAYAPLTCLADGCFSRFRATYSKSEADAASYFVGLVIPDRACLPFPEHGNVILAVPTPVLAYPIGANDVRILIDVPAPLPPAPELKQYILSKIVPQLPGGLGPALEREILSDVPLRSMPNLKLHPLPMRRRGVVLLGDAWNCRHPLTGGGMTVALTDVVKLRDALAVLPNFDNYGLVEQALSSFYSSRKSFAATINILAFALYKVFSAGSGDELTEVRSQLRNACFGYLRLGGACSRDPMRMLTGLQHSPLPLIRHFFQVAFYASVKLLSPFPTPSNVVMGAKVLWTAVEIISPLMYHEILSRPDYSLMNRENPSALPAPLPSANPSISLPIS